MIDNYNKLRKLLEELFQLDRADLDFGIYRIMNQKRDEITRFLDNDLLPQVQEAFKEYRSSDRMQIENQLNEAIEQASALGADPDTMPKVMELRAKYSASVDVGELENEVFSHLYDFFRRYYHEGDFLSLRRYKEGVYAIPYEGEEVKLHWANHDQYYIKTSEYLRDYTFNLPSGKPVHFKLVEADTEKDNTKAQSGQERRFILCQETPLAEENGELFIRFEYKPDPEKTSQKDLNSRAIETILNTQDFSQWFAELAQLRPTEKNPVRTLLEKHLADYTARNTFDYFIHKNLGGFLRRELDFYIKNEVMHLDDVEHESAPRVEQYLSKIKVIRKIAHKMIEFLAQIEDFQKKLWLKKKFVVETNYCVTLDRIPEKLYPEIAANDAQREEWVRLFAIDEIKKDLAGTVGYSSPLTIEFIKANPRLVVDTKLFDDQFKYKLLTNIDNIDECTEGLILHGNNFHSLKLLEHQYQGAIKCIYLDPPFNTGGSEFIYKNGYRHSSWCSMMLNVLNQTPPFLNSNGVLATAIDDYELFELGEILNSIYGEDGMLGTLVVENKPSGRTNDNFLAVCHEYYLCHSHNVKDVRINFFDLTEEQREQYQLSDDISDYKWRDFLRTGGYSTPEERPNSYYPIYWNKETQNISLTETESCIEILPIDSSGRKRVWRKTPPSFLEHLQNGDIMAKEVSPGQYKIYIKDRIKAGVRPKSMWTGSKYDASSHGTKLLKNMFGSTTPFDFPKSLYAVQDLVKCIVDPDEAEIVFDFFAGSGTTGHAVINQNLEDDGNRKFILVEMGDYLYTALVPRIKKAIYSKDWKDGKPVSREGSSHMFKYIRLESYEDTLNNLELKKTQTQQALLEESPSFHESYMLSYMLDVESKDSASLLNIDSFEDPFNYKLKIATGSAGETKPVTVDLVETFDYLIGLTVHHIDHIRGFRVVQGTNPNGEKVLIIWRNLKEKSNEDLDEFFRKQEYNPRDLEFDLIYVNGDNNVENLRREDETWKVRLIEEEFERLMFDVQDV